MVSKRLTFHFIRFQPKYWQLAHFNTLFCNYTIYTISYQVQLEFKRPVDKHPIYHASIPCTFTFTTRYTPLYSTTRYLHYTTLLQDRSIFTTTILHVTAKWIPRQSNQNVWPVACDGQMDPMTVKSKCLTHNKRVIRRASHYDQKSCWIEENK